MTEADAVARVDEPVTVASLVADLRDLGVRAGETLLVHSSLQSVGWVAGGAQAVVEALAEAVSSGGTVVVPTHTGQYTDPAGWSNPPVPDDWVARIRESMPPYRPDVTPSRDVGAVPECLRTYPDAVRSGHPVYSFAARGTDAASVVGDHELDRGLGEGSPLARVYDRGGRVLLLGVGHGVNTSIHLAEYRADVPVETRTDTAPVLRDGDRVVARFEDVEIDSDDFPAVGADYEREVGARTGAVGAAEATLVDQRSLVDFAVEWLERHR
jgi:aminoglycoside 3-N-acetyltransferase